MSLPMERLRVMHVITELNLVGGTEMALLRLLKGMDRTRFASEVLVLGTKGTGGTVGEQIEKAGFSVHEIGATSRNFGPSAFLRVVKVLTAAKPDLVQTWLYHPNVVGGLAARLCGVKALVWNIRSSPPSKSRSAKSRYWAFKAGRLLSHCIPDVVVSCSEAALTKHLREGYRPKRACIIHNGFDVQELHPTASDSFRRDLGIPATAVVVGIMARYHPDKDYKTFVRAAGILRRTEPEFLERHDVHFVACGDSVTWDNKELSGWIEQEGLRDRFHLLGRRSDPARVASTFDIATLTSRTEAFPNAVGEAMACGVPCVATNVGEVPTIIGDTGIVVPAGDAAAVAAAVRKLIEIGRDARARLGRSARDRVRSRFSLERTIASYEALYTELCSGSEGATA